MEQENNKQLTQIAESLQEIVKTMKSNPKEERYHAETHCPSCGRFVGTETRCPYCQAEIKKRLSIRVFKIISVLLSTLGLLMLLVYARNVKTPEVTIKELGPLSNFAHVRIVGFAKRDAIENQWGTLSFNVAQYYDKTGKLVTDRERIKNCEEVEIRVTAYKKVTEQIADAQKPRKGELVEVEGQVRVQQNEASLLVNAPEHITTHFENNKRRPLINSNNPNNKAQKKQILNIDLKAPPVSPESITNEKLNTMVKLAGKVKFTQPVANDCLIIRLENGKDTGLLLFVSEFSKRNIAMPQQGAMIEAIGSVKEYNGELEVSVKNKQEYIKILSNN